MDLLITLRIAPGEDGMAERHTYVLKEVKTIRQCIQFVERIIDPFVGNQSELPTVTETPVAEGKGVKRKGRQVEPKTPKEGKGKERETNVKVEDEDDPQVPWDTD